jgi:hypothetical protein
MTEGQEKKGKRRFNVMLVKGFKEAMLSWEGEILIVATKGEAIEGYTEKDLAFMSEGEFQEILSEAV